MKILVTGGAGFIGSHIVDHYIGNGDEVIVVDDLSAGRKQNIEHHFDDPKFTFQEASIENWRNMDEAIADSDIIYHLAAVVGVARVLENPVQVINVNQAATEKILKSVRLNSPCATILLASSSEVYSFGKSQQFTEEDDVIIPSHDRLRWCYAATKLADEMLAFAYYHQYGLNTLSVRLFNTVGHRQRGRYGMVLPHFIQQSISEEPVTVYGDGKQSRSFCDVRDTVKMLTALCECEEAIGQVINVGSEHEMSINKLARIVIELSNSSSKIEHISYEQAYGTDFEDIRHRCPDLTKLQKLTGYQAQYGIRDTVSDLIADSKRN